MIYSLEAANWRVFQYSQPKPEIGPVHEGLHRQPFWEFVAGVAGGGKMDREEMEWGGKAAGGLVLGAMPCTGSYLLFPLACISPQTIKITSTSLRRPTAEWDSSPPFVGYSTPIFGEAALVGGGKDKTGLLTENNSTILN